MSVLPDVFIGLEIHIHLNTESKMFCPCSARYGDEPNTNICPICLGYPGTLPLLNERAIEHGYLVARALGCCLSNRIAFARKNYFYPDMPKNYQITQYSHPVGIDGAIEVDFGDARSRKIRIHNVHLEEDAGKMTHSNDATLLDYNRAGYPLLEIVTEPDLTSGEEAELFLRDFRRLIRYLGVSDGNMEEGSMKCDANISINLPGRGLGTKVELKNMNSSRFVRLALNYEAERQSKLFSSGGRIIQETRLWNENRDTSEAMRRKETSDDYRYFPEPDMPAFMADAAFLERIEGQLVELPLAKKRRLQFEYDLNDEQAEFIHNDIAMSNLFEDTVKTGAAAHSVAAWLSSDVRKLLNRDKLAIANTPLSSSRFSSLLALIDQGRISGKIAKKVLERVFSDDADPELIVEQEGWFQISDPIELGRIVNQVLSKNPDVTASIREGDSKRKGWLMGEIMRVSNGKAAPELSRKILDDRIG